MCWEFSENNYLNMSNFQPFLGYSSVQRLQCFVYECYGICGHDLPSGVHVPCHSFAANMHDFC